MFDFTKNMYKLFIDEPELHLEYTVDIIKSYEVLDLLYSKDDFTKLVAFRDLEVYLQDGYGFSFNFDSIGMHDSFSKSKDGFAASCEEFFNDKLKALSPALKNTNYIEYAKNRYEVALISSIIIHYQRDSKSIDTLFEKLDKDKLKRNKSMDLMQDQVDDINKQLSENDGDSSELFEFSYMMLVYLSSLKITETKYAKTVKEYFKESASKYFDFLKREIDDIKDVNTIEYQKKLIKLISLKVICNAGNIKPYVSKLEKNIIFFIKKDIDAKMPISFKDSQAYLTNHLFYKFHKDITHYIQEILKDIDKIVELESNISNLLSSKMLYLARKNLYELNGIMDKKNMNKNAQLNVRVDNAISDYEIKIKKAITYEEFLDAQSFCLDDTINVHPLEDKITKELKDNINNAMTTNAYDNLEFLINKYKEKQPPSVLYYIESLQRHQEEKYIKEEIDKINLIEDINDKQYKIKLVINEASKVNINAKKLENIKEDVEYDISKISQSLNIIHDYINDNEFKKAKEYYNTSNIDNPSLYETIQREVENFENEIAQIYDESNILEKYKKAMKIRHKNKSFNAFEELTKGVFKDKKSIINKATIHKNTIVYVHRANETKIYANTGEINYNLNSLSSQNYIHIKLINKKIELTYVQCHSENKQEYHFCNKAYDDNGKSLKKYPISDDYCYLLDLNTTYIFNQEVEVIAGIALKLIINSNNNALHINAQTFHNQDFKNFARKAYKISSYSPWDDLGNVNDRYIFDDTLLAINVSWDEKKECYFYGELPILHNCEYRYDDSKISFTK